jgi:1,2-diacylglycerol 3-beta-galactosyltransferase
MLTKAGPGTISEAISSGLSVILYSRLNGPEDGIVRYIVDHGAGIWESRADLVVANVIRWLGHPDECAQTASAYLALAHPQAVREIAALIMAQIQYNV